MILNQQCRMHRELAYGRSAARLRCGYRIPLYNAYTGVFCCALNIAFRTTKHYSSIISFAVQAVFGNSLKEVFLCRILQHGLTARWI